jgi:allantoinase
MIAEAQGPFDVVVIGDVVSAQNLVRNGRVGVRDGRIARVWTDPTGARDWETRQILDMTGRWVLPGAVDAHVHCYSEPAEGFASATRAAAAGGVTTIIEMPYDEGAPVRDVATLRRKRERLDAEAVVDVALLGTIRKKGGLDQIPALAEEGVCGFKLSLFESDPDRFPRIDDGELLDAFRLIAESGLAAGVHAEDQEIITPLIAASRAAGKVYPRAHAETRPPVSETSAVALALEIAASSGTALHIYHASLPRTVELVSAARERDQHVTVETCPHYLLLDETDMDRLGPLAKINPPLRPREHVVELWQLLAAEDVDMVTSDHSPWRIERKSNVHDIFANASGIPGVQTLLPLMVSEGVAKGRITIEECVRLVSTRPAQTFGLFPQKGWIGPGADADLVVIDPHGTHTITREAQQSSAGWTPYAGREVQGEVVLTMVRGRVVYQGGRVVGGEARGDFVRPDRRPRNDERTGAT